jgi:hypothetical protein
MFFFVFVFFLQIVLLFVAYLKLIEVCIWPQLYNTFVCVANFIGLDIRIIYASLKYVLLSIGCETRDSHLNDFVGGWSIYQEQTGFWFS